ncbi:MAG: hypothetical protein H6Q23_2101 [Bacteroidetes bacterium]|nr:hypothetical protein [Bacteroidota bacterium]
MNTKYNLLGRRKWLKLFSLGSIGASFPGITNLRQILNSNDRIYLEGNILKQPTKKSNPVSLVKGDDHYEIIFKSLKNIEDEIIKSIGDKTILIKPIKQDMNTGIFWVQKISLIL